MRELTKLNVEKTAIFDIINYFEPEINKVITQSVKELENLNKLKEIQGLYQKNRIDKECIQNAIKTLNKNNDTHPTQNSVRSVKEKKENIEVT
jgi:Glu-tRNA(Gln) amidotransferase subunit E-like FAD-binding protein